MCKLRTNFLALKLRLQFDSRRFKKATGAWLNYKINFKTMQYMQILSANLMTLA